MRPPFLGWTVSLLGRFHDVIGPAHLLYTFATGVLVACGTRARYSSETRPTPPDYAHGVCRRCAIIAKRNDLAQAEGGKS